MRSLAFPVCVSRAPSADGAHPCATRHGQVLQGGAEGQGGSGGGPAAGPVNVGVSKAGLGPLLFSAVTPRPLPSRYMGAHGVPTVLGCGSSQSKLVETQSSVW